MRFVGGIVLAVAGLSVVQAHGRTSPLPALSEVKLMEFRWYETSTS
jgi:hypothetical protein